MKQIRKFLLSAVMVMGVASVACAQPEEMLNDPKFGNSREERMENIRNLQFFNSAAQGGRVDDALNYLRTLLQKAPAASEVLYDQGIRLYRGKRNDAATPDEARLYQDTLMQLYELRMEHFGHHAQRGRPYIARDRAADFYNYGRRRDFDRHGEREAMYKLWQEAIRIGGKDVDMKVLTDYFNILSNDYSRDLIETDEYLAQYEMLENVCASIDTPESIAALEQMNEIFIQSGAADCEALEKLFKPRYEANPNDLTLTRRIVAVLSRADCQSDFLMTVTENLYKLDPSPSTAEYLANAFSAKGDADKAATYYREAIDKETDPKNKARLYLTMANSPALAQNPRLVVDYARRAIALDSESGVAYLTLAQAYAGLVMKSCEDATMQKMAFLIVVDNLNEAKRRAGGDQRTINIANERIAEYSAYFPVSEDIFFNDIKEGDTFEVSCGIVSGKTIVRTRKQ